MSFKRTLLIISVAVIILGIIFAGCNKSNEDDKSSTAPSVTSSLEDSTAEGVGFEEDETTEKSTQATKNSNAKPSSTTVSKTDNSKQSTFAPKNSVSTTKPNSTRSTEKTTQSTTKPQSTKPKTTLPPKAPNQNGEWGASVKN